MLPDPIRKFVDLFAKLPSIGPRQATRLAFYIKSLGDANIADLAKTVEGLQSIKVCPQCFFSYLGANQFCDICSNTKRRKDVIALVEKETDLMSLEKTKKFSGRYLVLGELKKDGAIDNLQKLRLTSLKSFIKKELGGQAEEIILAMSPTSYGDLNASIIMQELKDCTKKISRLGRGLPTGGEIEFADEDTLSGAIDNRR
ncbi:MAG: toprim domain-containing protein [bacterium]|nr:toprim domain-containing protein [bacterium]